LINHGQACAAGHFGLIPQASLQQRDVQDREVFGADEIGPQTLLLAGRPPEDLKYDF
jgi:hypothetical protein